MNKNKYFTLTLISYNKNLLSRYLTMTTKSLSNYISMDKISIVPLPTRIKKFGVNRSPHVTNKSKEMFEIRQYSKMIIIKDFDDYLNFLQYADQTIPSGCNFKIKTSI